MKKLFSIQFWLFLLTGYVVFAQGTIPFVPPVYNYSQKEYSAGTQNWRIAQDSYGIIYVANNQGLLSFDGQLWELHHLPEKKIARSVFVDANRVYVGSFEEFGYFERNNNNQLIYNSLKSKISDYKFQNDEVWQIFKHEEKIYFQTFASFFTFDGNSVKTAKPTPAPFGMYAVNNSLYMQGIEADFYQLNDKNELNTLIKREKLNNDYVIGVFSYKENLILVTIRNGLFIYNSKNNLISPFKTDFDGKFSKISLNRALKTSNNTLILGSLNEGVFAINLENGQKIWHIDKSNGLKNNTVLGLYEDNERNIWVALDNGISYIHTQSKLLHFNLQSDIELVEDMEFFQGKLYLASNKGIYFLENQKITKIPELNEQIWFVKKFDNQLFVGHNKGISVIANNKIQAVDNVGVGGMDIKKGTIHGQEVLISSSYTFLSVYKRTVAGLWYPSHIIDGFSDLIKRIEIDYAGNIWADHVYKGVYRIELQHDLKTIKSKKLYNNLQNQTEFSSLKLLKLRGQPIFADGYHFYRYNDENQQITLFESLNENLPNLVKTQKIVTINDNLYWFITDKDYFLVSYEAGNYQIKDKIAFTSLINPSNEERATIVINEQGDSYFCLNESIAKYTSPLQNTDYKPYKLFLKSLSNYNRGADNFLFENISSDLSIDYTNNNLVFDFQYPNFSKENLKLMYFLDNYDKRWNSSNANFSVNYQNLPQGKYLLKAKIINDLGEKLSDFSIPFEVTTPWYKSAMALVLYFALGTLCCILLIMLYFRYKLKKKERIFNQEKAKKERLLEQQEQEITRLRNEKLETELQHKSKALAGATMMNIKHDDFLENLIVELENFMKEHKISISKGRQIIQHIRENISTEDEWQMFQENFDMIHKNFFRNLKFRYPNLTPSDLKLCVLLRLNYSSKEIASMQGVSIRGIETARYRLRKKLNLAEEDSLSNFLIGFE
ncbi:MAG: triple tyrosine motif-containing protein [Capnocytophaga sp.]|nr:triple tyrosine motif-containing protein [Capnocytophaga sp.]